MSEEKKHKILHVVRDRNLKDPSSSTELNLIYAAYAEGNSVSILDPQGFYVKKNKLYGITKRPNAEKINSLETYAGYLENEKYTLFEPTPLDSFDIVFSRVAFRDNGPEEKRSFDTTLNYLSILKTLNPKIVFMNDPDGIIKSGSKLYDTLMFEELMPETHITKDPNRLRKIIREANAKGIGLIGKPTDGMGGSSVMPLPKKNYGIFADLLIQHYENAIIQHRVEGVDRRLFLLDGEILAAYKKIPAEGDSRANVTVGATIEDYKLQKVDRDIVSKIKDDINRDGLYFCGLDIMGPEENATLDNTKILELNVRCPSGIAYLDHGLRELASSKIIKSAEKKYKMLNNPNENA
jgi:glutathione synthase